MDHLKNFIEFVTISLLLYGLVFFGHVTCGILAPLPGVKLTAPALEGKVCFFFKNFFIYLCLAVLGLCCCVWTFSSCGKKGLFSS